MKKIKVTHIISDSNIGGAGKLLVSLCSALGEKFENTVFIPKGAALSKPLSATSAKIYEVPMAKDRSFYAGDVQGFFSVFKELKTHIVHTHGALSARLGARLAGVPICLSTRHCAIPENKIEKKSILQRKIYNYCTDLTISTAKYATNNLISEGIDDGKITTIENGVAPLKHISREEKTALLRELKIPEGSIVLGSCARLEKVKGQDLMLTALHTLLKKRDDVYLLLVGEGSAEDEYKRLCSRLGIADNVRFLGFLPDPSPFQNIFTVNLNASRGTETSCLATSECMSLGIPTVASNFGGNSEMVFPYVNGLLFRSDDCFALISALSRIINDETLRKKLSSGAQKLYEKYFSLSRMAADYDNIYRKLYSETVKQ